MIPQGPAPSETDVLTTLRAWLMTILPASVAVIQGQNSRVAEPEESEFVVMTPLYKTRLATNRHNYQDAQFTASVADDVMTVSAVQFGTIGIGCEVWDVAGLIPIGATIISGPSAGGVGDYILSSSGIVAPPGKVAAGVEGIVDSTELDVQLDVHSAYLSKAGDMASTIVTLFRDMRGVYWFKHIGGDIAAPLWADDPHQVPFFNAEQQWESRWVITARLQVNSMLTLPQQYADQAVVETHPVSTIAVIEGKRP